MNSHLGFISRARLRAGYILVLWPSACECSAAGMLHAGMFKVRAYSDQTEDYA